MTSLKIIRTSEFVGKYKKYKIMVDNENVGTIKTGETVEIPIQPGFHELYIKLGWCRSNKTSFTIAEGKKRCFDAVIGELGQTAIGQKGFNHYIILLLNRLNFCY